MQIRVFVLTALILSLFLSFSYAAEGKGKTMKIIVASRGFKDGGMIPDRYSGKGDDVSPPITWSMLPKKTKSVALICDDPDAPAKPWVHWVIFNIPPGDGGLAENTAKREKIFNGALQGINGSKQLGYEGPFPPSGIHRYYFRVYALDTMLNLKPGVTKEDLEAAMQGHILGTGELMGKYEAKHP